MKACHSITELRNFICTITAMPVPALTYGICIHEFIAYVSSNLCGLYLLAWCAYSGLQFTA